MSFEIGQLAPSFELRVDDHQTVNLADYQGKKLILYFYPADDTPGCTLESCGFRDYYPEIKKLGAEILGVSQDDLESHKKFKTKYALPFDLGADEDGTVSTLYQALRTKESSKSREFVRSTFLIDETGRIKNWWPKVIVSGHLPEILAALQRKLDPMKAHIYLPTKTSMQSGRHRTKVWILEFKTPRLQYIEPLMQWTGGRETQSQVKMYFATCEEACQYAQQQGFDYDVAEPQSPAFKPKSYSDNFRADRLR